MKENRRRRKVVIVLAITSMSVFVAGCGGDDEATEEVSAEDAAEVEKARQEVIQSLKEAAGVEE